MAQLAVSDVFEVSDTISHLDKEVKRLKVGPWVFCGV